MKRCRPYSVSVTLSPWHADSIAVVLNLGVTLIADAAASLATCGASPARASTALRCTGRHTELELRMCWAFEGALRCLDTAVLFLAVPYETRRTVAPEHALFRA